MPGSKVYTKEWNSISLKKGQIRSLKINATQAFQIHFLFVGGVSFIAHQSCQLLIFFLSDTNSIRLTDTICLLTALVFNLFGFAAPLSIFQLRNLSQLTWIISLSYSS